MAWGQELQGFVEGGVAAVGKVFRGKHGNVDVRRHADPIEGLAIFRQINLIREPKGPTIGQVAEEDVGKHALSICTDADDMGLTVEDRHRERFGAAIAIGAYEQNNGAMKAWPL